jgi:hypothetical protein
MLDLRLALAKAGAAPGNSSSLMYLAAHPIRADRLTRALAAKPLDSFVTRTS